MQLKLVISFLSLSLSLLFALSINASCPRRTDYDNRCKKPCQRDSDCRRQKICVCDGVCGLSCVKKGVKCRNDYYKKPARGRIQINGRNLGNTIKYKCNRGYTLYGPSVITCSAIQKWKPWDKGIPTCKRVCPDPGHPKDGRRMGNKFEIGDRVRFRCNPGYELEGATVSVCGSSLTWSSAVPVCKTQTCSAPILPKNSEIWRGRSSQYLYGDRISLRCQSGYSRFGSSIKICGLGGWSQSKFKCYPKSCGDPGTPTNGIRIGSLFTYRKYVRYKCKQGFELHGMSSRQCLENQRWRGRLPECREINCGAAPVLRNGRYVGLSTRYGAFKTAKCDIGYELSGSTGVTCGNEGWTFTGSTPTCQEKPKDCFSLRGIANGQLAKNYVDHGEAVKYTCNRGYHIDKTPWQKCDDGQVVGVKPICIKDKPKDCTYIARLQNGGSSDNKVRHGEEVPYYCNAGYTLNGRKPKCDNGVIKERVPYCKKDKKDHDCTRLVEIPNGKLKRAKVLHGRKVKYRCNSGYALASKQFQECNNGVPVGQTPSCEKIPGYVGCYEIPIRPYWVTANSITECRNKCKSGERDYMGIRMYFQSSTCYCADKFNQKFSDTLCDDPCTFDNTMTCGGNWKFSVFKTAVTCPTLNAPINGRLSTPAVELGTRVSFHCDKNYQLQGEAVLECTSEGSWSHDTPTCVQKDVECPVLGVPPNTHVSSSDVKVGTKVTFSCSRDYHIHGLDTIVCTNEGKWSRSNPVCVKRDAIADRYIGCYKDRPYDRALTWFRDRMEEGSSFTEKCIKSCGKLKATKYAGLQFYNQCFCGESYTKHGKGNERSCDTPCYDFRTRMCGGSDRNSVYQTGCHKPVDPRNGRSHNRWYVPNERATYQCYDGFEKEGRGQLCDGYEWIGEVPECRKKISSLKCPLKFADAYLDILTDRNHEGARGIFRCIVPTLIRGDDVSTCLNGQWNGTRSCLRACDKYKGQGFYHTSFSRIHGSYAKLNCTSGARDAIYRCNNGNWEMEKDLPCSPTIAPICPDPKRIANGKFQVSGNTASYTCNSGYKMQGNSKITCTQGRWSQLWARCIISSRSTPLSCRSDVKLPLRALKDNVPNLQPQTFACIGGYELQGSAISLCNKGSLRQPAPKCHRTNCASCNGSSETFDSKCSKHDIVFIGKVTAIDKGSKTASVQTKFLLKLPKVPTGRVAQDLKPKRRLTLTINVNGDCICPVLKKRRLYVFYLKQKDWPHNRMARFATPIIIENTNHRRAQLGYFCRKAEISTTK